MLKKNTYGEHKKGMDADHLHLQFFMTLLVISLEFFHPPIPSSSFFKAIILPQISLFNENLNAHRFVSALNFPFFVSVKLQL